MAYKRQIGQLPIVPADAKEFNVVCHYCIVGCGYKAYTWDVRYEGGRKPFDNKFGADLTKQQQADTSAWYSPSMFNIVKQNGRDVNIVIKPDKECVVNSGLGSIRGARIAEMSYSQLRNTQLQRLTDPLVWRYGQLQPTSWSDALDLVAQVTATIINEKGEDALFVSLFDHGGAGGGYENTWGTGKLYFEAMKIRNIRIHNRPAYNSEVHATRDMGVNELNNCYEDAELADTIFAVGTNALETQTNYFLNHWIPNLQGQSIDKKRAEFGKEEVKPGRIIIVDPRRTVTINACEIAAGKENVLHLSINSGTDLILFNSIFTYIIQNNWIDKSFIDSFTTNFSNACVANKVSIEEAAKITGLKSDDIIQAATWIAKPKALGTRRRVMFAYEKGLIWGNDSYRTNAALVNLALATGNIGRPGGGCVRMGGHQEGYSRPSDEHIGRPAPYIDKLLIEGRGSVHHIWGCDHYKTTLNAMEFKRAYKKRTDLVKDAMNSVSYGDRNAMVAAIVDAINKGGLFSVDVDIAPSKISEAAHVILPAATAGEMNLTSMNGERRMRLTERYMDPPGQALPDCIIAARIANHLEQNFRKMGKDALANKFKGFDWRSEEDAFMDGYHNHANGGELVTYSRLRAMGTNGFQEPAIGLEPNVRMPSKPTNGDIAHGLQAHHIRANNNKKHKKSDVSVDKIQSLNSSGTERIIGTKRLYADGKFSRPDGRAKFLETAWRGLQAPGKQAEKDKFEFLINNGRTNHVWQSAYLDIENELIVDRWPYPFIEMNPDDILALGLAAGDLVEIFNDNGSTQAMVYPTPSAKPKQAFMLFGYPMGVQGNVVSGAVDELIIPNYKQTWANIRKISNAPESTLHLSFKSQEFPQ